MGNIYVMYIHLPGKRYDVNLFHLKVFFSVLRKTSSKIDQFFLFFFFFFAGRVFLDVMELLVRLHFPVYIVQSHTSTGCFRSTSQTFFFYQQIFLERFECVPCQRHTQCCLFVIQVFVRTNPDLFTTTAKRTLYKLLKFKTPQFSVSLGTEAKKIGLHFGSLHCHFNIQWEDPPNTPLGKILTIIYFIFSGRPIPHFFTTKFLFNIFPKKYSAIISSFLSCRSQFHI